MTKLFATFFLLLGFAALHAQKTRWGQEMPYAKPGVNYPVPVHVYGIYVRGCEIGDCTPLIEADVTSVGRKFELSCGIGIPGKHYKDAVPLSFGDFHARVLKNASGRELGDGYEVLLPNKRVLDCVLTGMLE